MSQPIQRDGVWWHQKADGTWLRWNVQKSEWESAPAPPPPPAPPGEAGPAATVPSDPVTKGREPAFGFSTAESEPPSTSGLPEGSEEVKWDFGDESADAVSLGPANADVLPPESDKPSASDWLNANRTVAALVAVVLLAAAAFSAFTFFGGDDGSDGSDPGTTTGSPIAKKDAVRKLNAMCSSAKRRMKGLGNPTSTDELVVFLGKARDEFKDLVRELNQVRPLPEDKADFSRIVKDFKKSVQLASEALAEAESGDLVSLQQTLVEMDSFSTKMRGRARAFGAHACATT